MAAVIHTRKRDERGSFCSGREPAISIAAISSSPSISPSVSAPNPPAGVV
ncbi:hypothetical protein ACP70R_019519 [Stipagrostis hirtigluma subsp. patula]